MAKKKAAVTAAAVDAVTAAAIEQVKGHHAELSGARFSAYDQRGYEQAYQGARDTPQLAGFQPGIGDADADSVGSLWQLRARSSDLMRNSGVAVAAIETKVVSFVGTGLTMQSRIEAEFLGMSPEQAMQWQKNVEREFEVWASSVWCDFYETSNFYEQQALAIRSMLERGDSFVLLTDQDRRNWPYKLALQVIEADRVTNRDFGSDTRTMVQGIIKTESGIPRAALVCSRHEGHYLTPQDATWTEVQFFGARSGRRNLLHLFHKKRPGQTRGIPELAPIIQTIKQFTRYSEAEVDAAVRSAAMAFFAKMDPDAFEELYDQETQSQYIGNASRWDGTVQSGQAINLLPGEDIVSPMQTRPNPNFGTFFEAIMLQVGMTLSIPKEVLTKSFQSSYSASKAALLEWWRIVRISREFIESKFCQPIYEEWLAEMVANGRIQAPGFFDDAAVKAAWCGAKWIGDGPGSIQPDVEASAAETRLRIGLTTLDEETIAYDGGDWEQKHAQQAREYQMRSADKLIPEQVDPNAQPARPPAA